MSHLECLELKGLESISPALFLSIISNHEDWYEMRNRITKRLRSNNGIDQNLSDDDINKLQVLILNLMNKGWDQSGSGYDSFG